MSREGANDERLHQLNNVCLISVPFFHACLCVARRIGSFSLGLSEAKHHEPGPGNRTARQTSRRRCLEPGDRKSTRLNSSHGSTSYAGFCLKKKNGESWD